MQGRVVRFDDNKGWGFVREDETGRDYFFHHSGILGQRGRRSLNADDVVSFDVIEGARGLQAVNVLRLSPV